MNSFTRLAAFLLALSITFHTLADEKKILYWYDPMVPDKHFDKPGKSPFMDMELVPKYASVDRHAVWLLDTTILSPVG